MKCDFLDLFKRIKSPLKITRCKPVKIRTLYINNMHTSEENLFKHLFYLALNEIDILHHLQLSLCNSVSLKTQYISTYQKYYFDRDLIL